MCRGSSLIRHGMPYLCLGFSILRIFLSLIPLLRTSLRILVTRCLIYPGIISDTAKNTFKFPRSYCLVLVSIGIFLSQVTAAHIDEISNLWFASAILGVSYGSVFSLFPQVCIEWFGLREYLLRVYSICSSSYFRASITTLHFADHLKESVTHIYFCSQHYPFR